MSYTVIKSDFKFSSDSKKSFPKSKLAEVCFLGRSNVGKSSLINAVLARTKLARVGRTPGVTKVLCFYEVTIRDELANADDAKSNTKTGMLVDLPGFGFAKLSKDKKGDLSSLLSDYLILRKHIQCVILLQDIRRDLGPEEEKVIQISEGHGIVLCLTKKDKISKNEITKRVNYFSTVTGIDKSSILPVSSTMSGDAKGLKESGMQELRKLLFNYFEN